MANAINAYGTIVQVNDADGGASYTNVADLTDVGSPSFSGNVVDVTTHNAGSPWREKRVTLLQVDDLTIMINLVYTNATHSHAAGLAYLMRNRLIRQMRWINNSDAGSDYHQISFMVSKWTEQAAIDNVYKGQVTFTFTGAPTFTVT